MKLIRLCKLPRVYDPVGVSADSMASCPAHVGCCMGQVPSHPDQEEGSEDGWGFAIYLGVRVECQHAEELLEYQNLNRVYWCVDHTRNFFLAV